MNPVTEAILWEANEQVTQPYGTARKIKGNGAQIIGFEYDVGI